MFGSCFYVVGGLLTLKISDKGNENVTASIVIWATLISFPIYIFVEQPWNYLPPRLDSTISLIYLGVFSTGIAWLLRFYILKNNGLNLIDNLIDGKDKFEKYLQKNSIVSVICRKKFDEKDYIRKYSSYKKFK